jgi:hypothetical protein
MCLSQVFHFKFSIFAFIKEVRGTNTHPCINLKTQPRFCPPSLSLTMVT